MRDELCVGFNTSTQSICSMNCLIPSRNREHRTEIQALLFIHFPSQLIIHFRNQLIQLRKFPQVGHHVILNGYKQCQLDLSVNLRSSIV